LLADQKIDKIILTKPIQESGENLGFLPGTIQEKTDPFMKSYFSNFEKIIGKSSLDWMIAVGEISVEPLAYMRGRTFKKSIILADQMQNATPSQMKMLLTRIGDESRIFVTGDLNQHDRGFEENGLRDFTARLKKSSSKMIGVVEFEHRDVERHAAVAEVLKIYGE
jgi:phosphate starvation-inducible PhoH-like protein